MLRLAGIVFAHSCSHPPRLAWPRCKVSGTTQSGLFCANRVVIPETLARFHGKYIIQCIASALDRFKSSPEPIELPRHMLQEEGEKVCADAMCSSVVCTHFCHRTPRAR